MGLDCLGADAEAGADFLVGFPLGEQLKDLTLLGCETNKRRQNSAIAIANVFGDDEIGHAGT